MDRLDQEDFDLMDETAILEEDAELRVDADAEVVVEEQEGNNCCRDCCAEFCRKLKTCLMFLVSHIGLITLVVAYCLLGAVAFEKIEKQNELNVKDNIKVMRSDVTDDIWDLTQSSNILKEEEWMAQVDGRMKKFELDLIAAMRKKGWNGHESHDKTQWTFTGSLFYSIICITTIGYGDQTPKTNAGKLVTIFYAVIGMPLMLFCLSNTGHAMAHSFRFLYWRLCCFLCVVTNQTSQTSSIRRRRNRLSTRSAPRRKMSTRSTTSTITNFGYRSPGSRSMSARRTRRATVWNLTENSSNFTVKEPAEIAVAPAPPLAVIPTILAQSYSTDNISTIDPNAKSDKIPRKTSDIFLDKKCHDTSNAEAGKDNLPKLRRDADNRDSKRSQKSVKSLALNPPREKRSSGESSSPSSPGLITSVPIAVNRPNKYNGGSFRSARTVDDDFLDFAAINDDYYEEEDLSKKDIPLWICGVLVLSYILGGAFLFSNWEKWKFLDSAYFCFITLTTIGFGDFVPKAEKEVSAEISIVICSVYLLFGMSLLVMTFNLVQQRVVNRVRFIAMRLGIVKNEMFEFE